MQQHLEASRKNSLLLAYDKAQRQQGSRTHEGEHEHSETTRKGNQCPDLGTAR